MYHTESEANVYGFTCASNGPARPTRKAVEGFNIFKAIGYIVCIVTILVAVF